MSLDNDCWRKQSDEAADAYLRVLLSNHRLPASTRAEFADAVRMLKGKAKMALHALEPVAVPAGMDGADS